ALAAESGGNNRRLRRLVPRGFGRRALAGKPHREMLQGYDALVRGRGSWHQQVRPRLAHGVFCRLFRLCETVLGVRLLTVCEVEAPVVDDALPCEHSLDGATCILQSAFVRREKDKRIAIFALAAGAAIQTVQRLDFCERSAASLIGAARAKDHKTRGWAVLHLGCAVGRSVDATPITLCSLIELEQPYDLRIGGIIVHVELPVFGQLIQRRAWAVPIAAFRLVEVCRAFRDFSQCVTEYGNLFARFDAGKPEFRAGYAAARIPRRG